MRILVFGGGGFIGSNAVSYFAKRGYKVTIFDNFSRYGTEENLSWIKSNNPDVIVLRGDIRNFDEVNRAVKNQDIIFHLAAQVAVTTSVTDPLTDFEINAKGTFNVLEAARLQKKKPIVIYSSTNKVYGGMEEIKIVEKKGQYAYESKATGISEQMNLDFHSPYGCSKGAADQYVRDYYRIYGIPTVVFRQSCIYGPRQFGIEDQGWVAWFIIATAMGKPVTVYGDGKQVRDVLYIDDLIKLFEIAVEKIEVAKGKVFNVGGGPKNTLAVWSSFGPILEKLFGHKIPVTFSDWRPGDQKVYISDIRMVEKVLGWKPTIDVEDGIERLFKWVTGNKELFTKFVKP